MFIKRRSSVLYRDYCTFGYITDNRNFGYNKANGKGTIIGDKILSKSGSIFMSVLNRKPQSINNLAKKIIHYFKDVEIKLIIEDAIEFYHLLEQDGFVVTGKTKSECEQKDLKFTYKVLDFEVGNNDYYFTNFNHKISTQEFLNEYFQGKHQITNLHIEITSKCNEKCLHCYIPNEHKSSFIEPKLFYDIIRQSRDLKVLHLTLSGGEPMLHPQFCDFLKKCREYDFSVNVLSNLTVLNDNIVDELQMNPLLGIQVSLYAVKPAIHDEITQMKGSFEKTMNSILRLIDKDIPLQISCPIIKQNLNCYDEVIEWAKQYKIHVGDDYGIIGRYNHETDNLKNRISINELTSVIYRKFENDSKYFEQIEIEAEKRKDKKPDDYVCSVCTSSICIADNGNVYPCAGWQGYVVGNIKEASLKDIWYNSKDIKYLRNIRNKDFGKCNNCNDKDFCNICLVRNANEDPIGDLFVVSDYFCNIARIHKQLAQLSKRKRAYL